MTTKIAAGALRAAASVFAFAAGMLLSTAALSAPSMGVYWAGGSFVQLPNGPPQLVIDFTDIDGAGFTGNLAPINYPSGMTGSLSSNACGGTPSALPGSIAVAGISVPPSGFCEIRLDMAVSGPGTYDVNVTPGVFVGTSGLAPPSLFTVTLYVGPDLTVTNTNDTGAGSLRAAIDAANTDCLGFFGISFNIPGAGPHVITPALPLPALTCNGAGYDGFSQPGSAEASEGFPADLRIVLDGSSCAGCHGLHVPSDGYLFGVAVHSFAGAGVIALVRSTVNDNYIGTDPGGMVALPNTFGIHALEPSITLSRNLVTGNVVGIVSAGGGADITYNQIGGNRDGGPGVGNTTGVHVTGGGDFVNYNTVSFNGRGIVISGGADASGNQVYDNTVTGIDVGDDGPTPPSEVAPYPFNPPFITTVEILDGVHTRVAGYVKTYPDIVAYVEVYHNATAPAAGTQGQMPIMWIGPFFTDGTGYASFDQTYFDGVFDNVTGIVVSDTCSEGCYETSEFSAPTAATLPVDRSIVTNTNDSGTGSLRDAIEFTNFECTPKAGRAPKSVAAGRLNPRFTVSFAITFNIPGAGVHTIQPLTPLPQVQCDGLLINGFSQPGSSPNGSPLGDTATRLIELKGTFAGAGANGLDIVGEAVLVRGLVINDFRGAGIMVSTSSGRIAPAIVGNAIGTDPSGSVRIKNTYGVRNSSISSAMVIGVGGADNRNIISGNDLGIRVEGGSGTQVVNNFIGLNAAGNGGVPNDTGISASGGTGLYVVGNVISGSFGDGVSVQAASTGAIVQGNMIGTDVNGVLAVPNGGSGVNIGSAGFVGGSAFGEGNVIAFNATHGVRVFSATGVSILGNNIFQNGGNGIDLNGALPATGTDSCDADTGANNLQNFPVISSVVIDSDFTTISGTFDSTAGLTYRLEFFRNLAGDAASNRAGRAFIGSTPVATTLTPSCATPFTVNLPVVLTPGDLVTATATVSEVNDTSMFSAAVAAVQPASCYIVVQVPAMGDATPFAPSPITVTPNVPGTLFANCNPDGTAQGFSWNTGGTSALIDITTPDFGASATYTVTIMTPTGPNVQSITLAGPPPGAPVCSITAGVSLPLHPLNTADVPVNSSCTGAPTTYSWLDGGTLQLVSGQNTPTGTYHLNNPGPGYGYVAQLTPSNASGTGPTANRILWVSPLDVAPTSLTFPATAVGAQSAVQTILLRNLSDYYTVNLGGGFGGPFVVTNNCPASLAPLTNCTMDVKFVPAAAGPATGSITVTFPFVPSVTYTVALTGTGTAAPVVSLTPSSLTFAARTVATTSTAQTVTLANIGNAPLNISSIAINGDFAYVSACGTTLAAGASCTIDVTFTPLLVGARNGTLTIVDDAAGSPRTVGLTGTGLSTASPVADVSPGVLDFPPQQVGSTSPAEVVTVTNSGNAPLTFSAITITGDFAIVVPATAPTPPACPVTLPPGASCTIRVVFRPSGVNLREGVLTISSNGAVVTVRAMGNGMIPEPPQLSLPPALTFATRPVGTTSPGQALAIRNTSAVPATITELTASGDFSVSDTCTTIAAGATCSPLVTFLPTAIGPREGALTVRTLRDADPYHVTLLGTGEENRRPVLNLTATRLGFGNAFLGQPVTQEVTLRNLGLVPLVVSGLIVTGDFFSDLGCVTAIPAGGSCTVRVTFLASVVGGRGGVLTVVSNDTDSPNTVTLGGTGCFMPTATRSRFGVLLCGS